VNESITQGIERLSELSLDETEALLSSAYAEFDAAEAAGNVDDMKATLAAAKTLQQNKAALVAAAASKPAEEPAKADEPVEPVQASAEEPVKADAPAEPVKVDTPVEPVQASTEAAPEAPADTPPEAAPEAPAETPPETPAEPVQASAEETTTAAAAGGDAPADAGTDTSSPAPAPEAVTASAEGEAQGTQEEEKTAMTASGVEPFQAPAENAPVVASATTAVVAGADVKGFSAGSPFKTVEDVSKAFIQRMASIKRASGGDGEQHSVATITASIPEERMLYPGDVQGNARKIEAVTGEQALVASGGYCAPLQVRYDIFGVGVTDRPVRDALAHFGASRGGIRYVAPPVLGDDADAVSLWTAANDRSPGDYGDATKPCLVVECSPELTAEADAIPLCLQFGNLMTRAFPELVTRHNQLALIEHARFAELTLLAKLASLSTALTAPAKLGIARDFLYALGKAGAAMRSRHRMNRNTRLRVIAPGWVLDAMREDLGQGLPGDTNLARADSEINGYLSARNISVSWHLDGLFQPQVPGALVNFPSTFHWYMYPEGTFLFLDGGTLDLGVIRDSGLVATNDYKTFVETFEGVAKIGVEAIRVSQASEVEGSVIGTTAASMGTP
jgi:hypothetical protein